MAPGVAGDVVGLETVLTAESGGGEEEGMVCEWLKYEAGDGV
jgi:hypothetical protein